mmetsp:Transcript_28513/g.47887  ORF Transcript_28513/g.47887 Transcript_28513/m.47887 type:complete len:300 (+) Transcript_28513:161-1060(+)
MVNIASSLSLCICIFMSLFSFSASVSSFSHSMSFSLTTSSMPPLSCTTRPVRSSFFSFFFTPARLLWRFSMVDRAAPLSFSKAASFSSSLCMVAIDSCSKSFSTSEQSLAPESDAVYISSLFWFSFFTNELSNSSLRSSLYLSNEVSLSLSASVSFSFAVSLSLNSFIVSSIATHRSTARVFSSLSPMNVSLIRTHSTSNFSVRRCICPSPAILASAFSFVSAAMLFLASLSSSCIETSFTLSSFSSRLLAPSLALLMASLCSLSFSFSLFLRSSSCQRSPSRCCSSSQLSPLAVRYLP